MRTLILGIDSGKQSHKVLAVDARDGKVIGTASQAYDLIPGWPPGAKEQHPHTWRDATGAGIRQAPRPSRASGSDVVATLVAGPSQGFRPSEQPRHGFRP